MNKEADLATRPWRICLVLQSKGVYATFAGIGTPACPQRVPILGLSSSPGMLLQKTDDADLHLWEGARDYSKPVATLIPANSII